MTEGRLPLARDLVRAAGAENIPVPDARFDVAPCQGLLRDAGFHDVRTEATVRELSLPEPRSFLWQYIHSTPLAAVAADLDDDTRAGLERDVTERWQEHVRGEGMSYPQRVVIATAAR